MEEGRSGARIVKAMVPLAEMFGYVTALRTITSGRATSSMEYDHHAPLSSTIAKAVLEEVKGHADKSKGLTFYDKNGNLFNILFNSYFFYGVTVTHEEEAILLSQD